MVSPTNTRMQRCAAMVSSGRAWQWIHGAGTVAWLLLVVPSMTIWRDSVPWVVFMSIYAIVLSHTVGFVASVGARKADKHDSLGD